MSVGEAGRQKADRLNHEWEDKGGVGEGGKGQKRSRRRKKKSKTRVTREPRCEQGVGASKIVRRE